MELYIRMRTLVEPQARVQDYFAAKSSFIESYVSETPPFANRSLYVGDAILSRIFQTPKGELKKRRDLAETLSESEDPRILAHLSHRAGIEYVVAYPHEPNPFDASGASRYFEPVTRVYNWGLYRVLTGESPLFHDHGDYLWYEEKSGSASLTTLYGTGFHPVELLGDDEPARWMSQDAVIRFDSAGEFRGTLIFLAHSYARARTMELSWNGEPAVIWQFGRATKKVSLPVVIPAGRSELRLRCVEGPEKGPGSDKRQLSFKIWAMQFVPQE